MSVGEAIARARAERGMSVDDVSNATRVRATLVREIEADDFTHCGGDVYARGHIRSIARVVGLDPGPLIEQFDAEHGGTPVPTAPVSPFDPSVAESTKRRRPNWAFAMVAALLVVIGLAAAQLATGSGGGGSTSDQPTVAETTPSPSRLSPTPVASSPTSPPPGTVPPGTVAQVPADKVTVLVRVVGGSSWLSVKNGAGQVLYEGLMRQGESRLFDDPKELRLVVGNAPAVDLVVNSHDIGAPPSQGNVARLVFRPGDLRPSAG